MLKKEISIIIADDHPIVRQGFQQMIGRKKHLKILAESSDGLEALKNIEEFHPDVAILDIDMPKLDGFDVARAVKEKNLLTQIIFLTIHDDEEMLKVAIDIGAKGFVLKDSALEEITSCIEAVANGRHYVSPALSDYLVNQYNRTNDTPKKLGVKDLTPTERHVLKLISENKTTKEIAQELFISYRTVETHRSNICQKLNLKGTNSLLKFALIHKSDLH